VSAELLAGEIIVLRGILATAFLAVGVAALGAARPMSILFHADDAAVLASAPRRRPPSSSSRCATCRWRSSTRSCRSPPCAVTAGAALVYGERVGRSRWAAALTGFLSVALIVKPGIGGLGAGAYVVLLALACTTVRDVTTRGLERSIPSIFVAAASSAAIIPAGFLVAPFEGPWTFPSAWAWGLITAAAACFFVANTLIIMALRTGEIGVVAPFRYVAAPFSVLLGFWWWGDIPDAVAFLGIGLVVAAGVYTLHRERGGLTMATASPGSASP
jgi:uncharacterized membrane protein